MQKIGLLILTALHIICLYGTSEGNSFALTTTYEIVHTHNLEDDHDHMDDFKDHNSQATEDHENRPHKHELAVKGQIQYVQNVGIDLIPQNSIPLKYGRFKTSLPVPPHLNGIFRPPISA